jgi:hypothetical protein
MGLSALEMVLEQLERERRKAADAQLVCAYQDLGSEHGHFHQGP